MTSLWTRTKERKQNKKKKERWSEEVDKVGKKTSAKRLELGGVSKEETRLELVPFSQWSGRPS